MIYIPIDLRLSMMQEDLEEIKLNTQNTKIAYSECKHFCLDCELTRHMGGVSCSMHAHEYQMRINFPLDNSDEI